jgi:hypothetical protein
METPRSRRITVANKWFWVALTGLVLTQPVWNEPVLKRLDIHTPEDRQLAELTLTSDRATRQVDNLQAQLREAIAATNAARAETATATRVADAARARLNMLALVQLSAAIRQNGRFDTELAMVLAAGESQNDMAPLLERVRPYAPFGIPSLPQLRRDLASQTSWSDRSVISAWRLAWVPGLVGWSRPVPPANDPTGALISQAHMLLLQEDLPAALAVIRQLPESTRAAVSDWIEDASARVSADALVRQVAIIAGQSTGAPQ